MPDIHQKQDNTDACAAVGELLSAYIDGELSAEETAQVEAHLRDCPTCARLAEALTTLRRDIADAQLEPPPQLHSRIMAAVHRENRMRRLRRFTAIASAGVAAMFCFVVIGGAILRSNAPDAVMYDYAARNAAPMEFVAEVGDPLEDGDAAMTGAAIDTTLEGVLTIAGTALADDTAASPEQLPSANDLLLAAPADTVERKSSVVNAPETTSAVMYVRLAENRRDLSRVVGSDRLNGLSTTGSALSPEQTPSPLADVEGRLADEQLGTLCIVELDDGRTLGYATYDLITGRLLSLADFLGDPAAPAVLGAAADTPYRPTADGLILYLPDGEVCLGWTSCPTVEACIDRYAMTKAPLCGE